MGYSFRLAARVLLYALSYRQDNTYHGLCHTSRGALTGTRNSSMGPPHEGSIRRPIAPWANALTTGLHLTPGYRASVVKDQTDNERANPFIDYSYRKQQGIFYFYYPTDKIVHTRVCAILLWVVHIKDPLLLIWKSNPCSGDSGFPLSLSKLSFTIFPTPYNRKYVECVSLNKICSSFHVIRCN